jgi:hypothetical protein
MLSYGERREQRALLEGHAPPIAYPLHLVRVAVLQRHPEHLHLALGWGFEPHHLPQERRLAAAGAADQRQHLARSTARLTSR